MILESFVLGTSGSLPLPKRSLSSILLHREGQKFLFDCGEGVQVNLKAMRVRWKHLRVICISHSHADHVTGLPGILMLCAQVNREEPLTIICPHSVKNFITSVRKELGIYVNYDIEYITLDDVITEAKIYEDENKEYDIFAFPGRHTRDVWGFSFVEKPRSGKFFPELARQRGIPIGPLWSKLQQGQSVKLTNGEVILPHEVLGASRRGRKVCYVTDTRPTEDIAHAIVGADMVFCEGMFKHEHSFAAKEKYHMTGVEAAQLMHRSRVIKAGLTHFSPRYLLKDIYEIEREAQQVFPNIFCCRDKMRIFIPYDEDEGVNNGVEYKNENIIRIAQA